MKIVRTLDELPDDFRHGAVAVGNFDGVHLGHARIVERLRAAARRLGGPAVVFTFDPHPVRLLRPEQCPPPLTWTDRKAELLEALGIDGLVVYPTDTPFLSLTAREFFERVIRGRLDARGMVEGRNFFFGHDRQGNIETLRQFTGEAGMELEIVEPVVMGGQPVSSSRVRRLVANGDVAAARAMLTQPYRIRGLVTHGAARGAQIGFPTANVEAIDTLLPAQGVYAGRAYAGGTWPAAINIGPNPTFGESAVKVEAHLAGFHGSLYGQVLEVDFLARLREIQTFANVAALKQQLNSDVRQARDLAQQAEVAH